ncbi:MAG TPA: hypothetical protein VEY67_07335, partial [Candidatus Dormibacteraeota bacterium]|nr:hypothetical protein [Candidatus Dormibacteraeota bacterium]
MFATLAGALPQPKGEASTLPDGVATAISLQVELGLEPVTDGDLRGEPLVTTALGLEGVVLGRAGAPVVASPEAIRWSVPIHLERWRRAAALTARPVKQLVGGPYSLALLLAPDAPERKRRALTLGLAESLVAALRALASAG